MPLQIRERRPRSFNVVKPRNELITEKTGMKKTAGSVKPETLQSLSKLRRQTGKDLGGRSGWKAPSSSEHDGVTHIHDQMNKNYEDHFFQINRGHNKGSVRPDKHLNKTINGAHYFR